jgi:NADPH2:quinone reductase
MRAIIIKQFGGLDGLVIEQLPDPVPQPGSVLIEVKAFGINHAETHMRKGEWAEAATVSGIECVGLVKACPGGEFEPGTKVAAFMGGMGRTINGSYAEYTCPPVTNVIPIKTDALGRVSGNPGILRHRLDVLASQFRNQKRSNPGNPRGNVSSRSGGG